MVVFSFLSLLILLIISPGAISLSKQIHGGKDGKNFTVKNGGTRRASGTKSAKGAKDGEPFSCEGLNSSKNL